MEKILLDTNFILTCIKQKIDFFEQLELDYEIMIPKQVINELKRLDKIGLSLKILSKNKYSEIDLRLKNVDNGIAEFAKKNPKLVVATLDKELQGKMPNHKMIIRGKKKLEVI